MGLTATDERCGGRGMTVNTERNRGHRGRMIVAMTVEVGAMTGGTVLAADSAGGAAA